MGALEPQVSDNSEVSSKGLQIARSLRGQIVAGELAPGSRMPTRSTLEALFDASPVTVQKAFDALIRDEFVEVINKRTYVAEHPPHLTRYALLFMENPVASPRTARFFYSLHQAALALDDDQRRKLPIYCDANPFRGTSSFQQLAEDVLNHRVAGLIFTSSPRFYLDTPVLHEPRIPRVAITMFPEEPGIPIVTLDRESFVNRALEILVGRGRRRIAVLDNYYLGSEAWEQGFARFGLPFQAHWVLRMPLDHPATVKDCVRLLMHGSAAGRPDGLVVGDDNVVPAATAGISACGVEAPRDLDIVAHCNFPSLPENHVPVHWLGFDVPALLKTCLRLVDSQRRNEPVEPITPLFALSATEVSRPGATPGQSFF